MPAPGRSAPDEPHDAGALAHALEPAIRAACDDRLSTVEWFRADWQRGGAATGYARFQLSPSDSRDVVVKLPLSPIESRFLVGLASTDAPTPRVVAHGDSLGGYDLAWVVMERVPGAPLSASLHPEVFADICNAAAAFHRHAGDLWPVASALADAERWRFRTDPDWPALIDRARHAAKDSRIPEASRWNDAIRHAQRSLPRILPPWLSRPIRCWRHGDLHPGNAMRRPDPSPWGQPACILLDFAETTPGHWVEDAVYLERMHWGRASNGKPALDGVKTVSLLAKARKALGLETDGDYGLLANLRRVLTAATLPAFLDREGTKAHLHAGLETLERLLPLVTK
jgi:hypothetical protein